MKKAQRNVLSRLKGSLKQSEMNACRELEGSLEIAQSQLKGLARKAQNKLGENVR